MNDQIDSFSTSRNCVFIDLNTAVLSKMKALEESTTYENKDRKKTPTLKLAFPPLIEPKDLIVKPTNGGKPPRAPNAFIIYRKIFVETAKDSGYHLPMTVISSMASKSWENESVTVKSHYKRLASEAYKYRNELYPKLERRRRRSRWNIISFPQQEPEPEPQEPQEQQQQYSNDSTKTPELVTSSSDSSPVIVDDFSPIFLSSPLEDEKEERGEIGITDEINKQYNFCSSNEFSFQSEFYPNTISNNFFPIRDDSIPITSEQFCFDHGKTVIYSPVYSSPVEKFSPNSDSPQIQQILSLGPSNMNINSVNDFIAYNQLLGNYNQLLLRNISIESEKNNNILNANDLLMDNYPNTSNALNAVMNNDALGISQFPFSRYSNPSGNSEQ